MLTGQQHSAMASPIRKTIPPSCLIAPLVFLATLEFPTPVLVEAFQPSLRPHRHPLFSPCRGARRQQHRAPIVLSIFSGGKNDEEYSEESEGERRKVEEPAVFPPPTEQVSPVLQETSLLLRRVSWLSWWTQVILSTVAAVILTFAQRAASTTKLLLPTAGLLVSAASVLWTWGNGARLSRRLVRKSALPAATAASMLRRAIRVGVTLNLVGLLIHLWSAQEIVGALALRVLTSPATLRPGNVMYASAAAGADGYLQPLDVLVVQANTNALLSHFCSLACLLFLTRTITALDPPSTVGNSRTRT